MKNKEEYLKSSILGAKGAAKKFDDVTSLYVFFSYAGCVIIAIVAIFLGWNWLLIGYAAAATLTTAVISGFAGLQSAKLRLSIAVAETESAVRLAQASEH